MKGPSKILLIAIVAVGGYYVWQNAPGLRSKVSQAANKYGGWNEEARQDDPVGFIKHARTKLEDQIKTFEQSRTKLAASKRTAEDRIEEFTTKLAGAQGFASECKSAFQTAEGSGAWPVKLLNKDYAREDLITQVKELLIEERNAEARITDYTQVLERVEEKSDALRDRISSCRAKIDELTAQEELVKIDTLTAEADTLLAQVNELIEGNSRTLEEEDDPVRSVAELIDAAQKAVDGSETAAVPGDSLEADALAFLSGN